MERNRLKRYMGICKIYNQEIIRITNLSSIKYLFNYKSKNMIRLPDEKSKMIIEELYNDKDRILRREFPELYENDKLKIYDIER